MAQQLNPYITVDGNCAEAMAFYGEVFGAAPQIMTFRDSGMDIDGVMHSNVAAPNHFNIFASDHAEGMGDEYGQLVDRFGIIWHVNIAGDAA